MDSRPGWLVVLGSFLSLVITAGLGFSIFGVVIEPIMTETSWSLSQVTMGVTIWGIGAAVLSPVLGWLIDRFGARRMMIFGCLLNFVTTLAVARATELWHFYIVMAITPIGAMANTYIPVAAVVARWFVLKRGIATGLAMLGIGVGGGITPLLANELINRSSWREMYSMLAFGYLLALVPILLWVRNPRPEVEAAYVAGIQGGFDTSRDLTLAQSLRSRSFWGLSLGDMLTGLIYSIFNVLLVTFLANDYGDSDTAAVVFSTFLIMLAVGTLVFGPLADRFNMKYVLVFCYALPGIAMTLLLPGGAIALAFVFAVIAGLAGGGRSAIFPVAVVYSFGETHMASIYGFSNTLFMIGNAAGPLIGGYLYESTGNTKIVYLTCIGTILVSASLVSLIRNERP